MIIIKEKAPNPRFDTCLVIVRTDLYSRSLSYFEKLKAELVKDFPGVECDPEVVIYGGDTHKGQAGLEMIIPIASTVPVEYREVIKLIAKAV